MNNSYEPRLYRNLMGKGRFKHFSVAFKETDLWIGVESRHYCPDMEDFTLKHLKRLRTLLEEHIRKYPEFFYSLVPYNASVNLPEIAAIMVEASKKANVGPMAAVAGAFSQEIGRLLEDAYGLGEIAVENGGDIYIKTKESTTLSVYVGNCALSDRIAIEIPPTAGPLGICTSSGRVGHSLSFGIADAVTVICKDAALADAYATYFGNIVQPGRDIKDVLAISSRCKDIIAILVVAEDKLGARGGIKLVPVHDQQ